MVRAQCPADPCIVLVGATGALGATVLELIGEHRMRHREIRLVASAQSAGREIPVGGRTETVHDLEEFDFAGADLVLFCAGEAVSRRWVPVAMAEGALVVDASGAFSLHPEVPLVVPSVNDCLLSERPAEVVAVPSGMTVPLTVLLHAVERWRGVRQVVMSTYEAASGLGHQGVEELLEGSELTLRDPEAELPADRFHPALAFNVLPAVDGLQEDGTSREEQRLVQEAQRVLGLPDTDVAVTCVRVPVVSGHGAALFVETAAPVDRPGLVELLASLPDFVVHDREAPGSVPTPLTAGDPDRFHVGRVRVSPRTSRGFMLWLVFDNLRAGGASTLLRIARIALASRASGKRLKNSPC
ncbi:aspartate-semialdehyde dehydrogenase [Streptomyces pratensis]|uniref:aspartate-semialdehyde dehydrogenase n=1 Tax=Streptomyces pratensis TaxID=1169025 RepID=UPI001931792B|nr:aspartate-semialdehyde dehydrogenase [Streptomyces pratensis]